MRILVRNRLQNVALAISLVLMPLDSFAQTEKMSPEEFRGYINTPNFNRGLFRFDYRKQGEYADLMKSYTAVIVEEFEKESFNSDPATKSQVYELLIEINYHVPVTSPIIWENALQDLTNEYGFLRFRAANFAAASPEEYREKFMERIKSSLDTFGMGEPTGQLLQTVVQLVRDGDQGTFRYLKALLDIPETSEGEKIFAILAMLKCAGVKNTLEFMDSRGLDERVAAGSALIQFETDSKGYTDREESSLIRDFITETTVEYLEVIPESEQSHPDYLSALVNVLLRTVGNDPFDTSSEQLAVNLEVTNKIRKVLASLDDESRIAAGLKTILERFSEDGTYTR